MRNRNVGFLIAGMSVILAILIILFDNSMRQAIALSCSHGPTCSMYSAVSTQTWIALAVVAVVFLIGLFFILSKESERTIIKTKTVEAKRKPINLEGLDKEEKEVVKLIEGEGGAIFQASLMEKIGKGKVGITRLLDKLEAKQIIERKRRGMNNVVVLKD